MKSASVPGRIAAVLVPVCLLAAFFAFLAFPARCLAYISDGISLWAVSVLPAALPFLFLTGMLAQTPLFARLSFRLAPLFRPFGVSGESGGAALLSLLSGYPAGAKTVQRLCAQGRIPQGERLRCACLASTSGPAFLVGIAGTAMAGSPTLGWLLFISHVVGIFGISLLIGFPHRGQTARMKQPPAAGSPVRALPETLTSCVLSVLTVGGAVALFYAFGKMLADALAPLALPEPVCALLAGLLEMTAGAARLLASPTPLNAALTAFLVTFGGGCVLLQQWSFLAETGISPGKFLLVKLCQAALAAAVCYPLVLLFQP